MAGALAAGVSTGSRRRRNVVINALLLWLVPDGLLSPDKTSLDGEKTCDMAFLAELGALTEELITLTTATSPTVCT